MTDRALTSDECLRLDAEMASLRDKMNFCRSIEGFSSAYVELQKKYNLLYKLFVIASTDSARMRDEVAKGDEADSQ
jgi:hypothetical protein